MTEETSVPVPPGYAIGQLARALRAAAEHPDAGVRDRARDRLEQWSRVLEGMLSGALTVGSRTPVAGTPAWVTLEVAHGGFATGRYLAEGALQEHEVRLLGALAADIPGDTPRERLNLYYAGDQGQRELTGAITSGAYRITLPEEGALPVIAWLTHIGRPVEALDLLAAIRPLMHRLRFFPELLSKPRPAGATVRVAEVGKVAAQLAQVAPPRQLAAMNASCRIWGPLLDRLVDLWLTTVEGPPPAHARTIAGERIRRPDGQPEIAGGWPCRRFPADWVERREFWLADFRAADREQFLATRHRHPKSTFAILRQALERCPVDSRALTARDVGAIRHALAGTIARHGVPGSDERRALRLGQRAMAERPSFTDLAHLIARRMERYPGEGGLPSLEPVERPVQPGEDPGIAAGQAIPAHLVRKAARALEAPIADLVERGIIGSAETLAVVLPQVTAQVAAAGIADQALRDLFARIYAAFRRRRSLLLLDLGHQIRFEELPWIAALQCERRESLEGRGQALAVLEQTTLLALSAFPHTILPNPLVRELGALAAKAGLELPLVEEVAADIFMGTFTEKWAVAARSAREFLGDGLYARYYDLDDPDAPARHSATALRFGKKTAEGFADLCRTRAREAGEGGRSIARNGAVLEQSQILTTHNLAVLVQALGLRRSLALMAPTLAGETFRWIIHRQTQVAPDCKSRLRMLKNTAYAWRQALFFLTLCEARGQEEALAQLSAALTRQPEAFRARFAPAVAGLEHVRQGGRFDPDGRGGGGRRFLGWSCGPHWLMPANP